MFSAIDIYSLSKNGILLPIVYLLVIGVFYISLCLMLDNKIFLSLWYMLNERVLRSPVSKSRSFIMDSDVVQEQKAVAKMSQDEMQSYSLVTKELSKMYGSFCSVNRLSFTVES